MRRLLARRELRCFIAGQVLSTLGDSAMWIAVGIWIKMLTGSSSAAGLSFFAFIVGNACSPAAGLLVDRVRRRPLLIRLNLLAAVAILPLLLVHGRHGLWIIYTVMVGYGFLNGLIASAQTALMQTVVPAGELGEANGLLQTLLQGLRLVTPLLGAGAVAVVGIGTLVVADAATFLAAALLLVLMRTEEPAPVRSAERMTRQVTAGVRHVLSVPALRQLVLAAVLAVTAFGFAESVCFAVVDQGLHRPPAFLGVLTSAQGAGAVVAGIGAAALMRRIGEGPLVALGLVAAGAGFLLLAPGILAAALLGTALVGASLPWILIGLVTSLQRRTPPELMGRADAAFNVLVTVPQAASIAVGAALLAVVDFRLLLCAMTALMLLAAAFLGTRRDQRTDRTPEAAAEAAVQTVAGVEP